MKKVLVVDDNPFMLNIISFMLKTSGYSVITAINGKTALDLLAKKHSKINLFILDLYMPYINGIELASAIKKNKKYRDTPIILMTALNKLKVSVHDTGLFNHIIDKPFDPSIVLDTIYDLLLANETS